MVIGSYKDLTDRLDQFGIKYFLTGSRCWNCWTRNSDYDIGIDYDSMNNILADMRHLDAERSSYNAGIKIKMLDDTEVNLIPLTKVDFEIWKLSTEYIRVMTSCYPSLRKKMGNKQFRISLFEMQRALTRMMIT